MGGGLMETIECILEGTCMAANGFGEDGLQAMAEAQAIWDEAFPGRRWDTYRFVSHRR